ncbi:MAG: chorismate mutase [Actinomycetes bacterium]
MTVRLYALRGAITCELDSADEISLRTRQVVSEMLERNAILHDDIVSIIFTSTDDLVSQFPATAARALGLGDVPLICARELSIEGAMKRVIRVLMHVYSERTRAEISHVYLEGARSLRDDLPG